MKVGIVILHYGDISTTARALRSLSSKEKKSQLYLVNNTNNNIDELINLYPHTKLISPGTNLGFAKGVNLGIKNAISDNCQAILLLNNDLTFVLGNIDLLSLSLTKGVGIVGGLLHHSHGYDWGGKFNRYTSTVKHQNFPNAPKTNLSVDHAAAAAILISADLIKQIGYFDERFFLYYEDLDFMMRAKKAGYKIVITPRVVFDHSTSSSTTPTKRLLYQWHSHLIFINKYLFKPVLPTAYLYNFFIYPLFIAKSFLTKKS